VGGRVISLPAPATREGRTWLVPIEIVNRALGPLTGQRIDLRKPSRLVIVGDLRVPRVTQRFDAQGGRARISLEVDPPAPHRVTQDGRRLVITFEADAIDVRLSPPEPGSIVSAVRPGDTPTSLIVDLGPAFTSFRRRRRPGRRRSDADRHRSGRRRGRAGAHASVAVRPAAVRGRCGGAAARRGSHAVGRVAHDRHRSGARRR